MKGVEFAAKYDIEYKPLQKRYRDQFPKVEKPKSLSKRRSGRKISQQGQEGIWKTPSLTILWKKKRVTWTDLTPV